MKRAATPPVRILSRRRRSEKITTKAGSPIGITNDDRLRRTDEQRASQEMLKRLLLEDRP